MTEITKYTVNWHADLKPIRRWRAAGNVGLERRRNAFDNPSKCRHPAPDKTYSSLLGPAAWHRLAPAIRERFGCKPGPEGFLYSGVMEEVRCSRIGWGLAWLARLIGTPLAYHRGRNIPILVDIYSTPGGDGIVWDRYYRFPGKKTIAVRSAKAPDRRRGLVECVGGGFGMYLKVLEGNAALHFVSQGYFWQCGRLRIPLPGVATPGHLRVVHTDEGGGWFRFTMTVRHPLFGETYFQDGRFTAIDATEA